MAALVLGLGAALARLTWVVAYPPAPVTPSLEDSSPPPRSSNGAGHPADRLAELSLFGEEETKVDAPKMRASALSIRLQGVISGPAPLAMVQAPGGVELYQAGESISEGVVIHAIEPNRIVVDNGGRLESIDLPGAQPVALDQAEDPAATSAGRSPLSRLTADPESLLDLINVAAERRDDRVIGYRVSSRPGRERLLQQVGLADGDVITHIADAPLSDPGNLARLMDRLNRGGEIAVRIERDGNSIETMIDTGTFQ